MNTTIRLTNRKSVLGNMDFNGDYINKNVYLVGSSSITGTIHAEDEDYFKCLKKIRIELEKYGFFLLCKGSMPNVYPSRMSSQMGKGIKAYMLHLGKQASLNDIVNIFDSAELFEIGTVEEQIKFYDNWIDSLG